MTLESSVKRWLQNFLTFVTFCNFVTNLQHTGGRRSSSHRLTLTPGGRAAGGLALFPTRSRIQLLLVPCTVLYLYARLATRTCTPA